MELWTRIRELIGRSRLDRDLDEEMGLHLSLLEEEFRASGMSEREARAAARREFGGIASAQQEYRADRGMPRLENFAKDTRYAARGLLRNPGFAAAAILSLALGIGANTAVFSVFHAVMMRSLPVSHPEQLVMLYRSGGWGYHGIASYPLYQEMRTHSELFSGVMAISGAATVRFGTAGEGRTEFVKRAFVSGDAFEVLGVKAAMGRLFTAGDDRVPHAHPVAVLNYDFWRNRLAADPQVLGRTLSVDEMPFTVIGVAAPGFRGVEVETRADIFVPAMMTRDNPLNIGMNWLFLLARLRPGVSREHAQSAASAVLQQYLQVRYGNHPNLAFRRMSMDQHLEIRNADAGVSILRDLFGKPLTILMAAVGLVLLASCANVANLLLARAAARRREIAMRFSLGATRARLVAQALAECALLVAAGCALGVLLAVWGAQQIVRFLPGTLSQNLDASPDLAVLAFTVSISLLSVLLFGLAPAWRSTAVSPAPALRSGSGAAGTVRQPLRRFLVVAQVAFSVVLVVLAALFARSLAQLRDVDLGFHDRSVIAFKLNFPSSWAVADRLTAQRRIVSQIETLPGVSLVSYGFPGPFQMGTSNWTVSVPGSARTGAADLHTVAPNYLEAIGATPTLGRDLSRTDSANSPKVAVVNQAFVRDFLESDPHPLGRIFTLDDDTEVVGVIRDIPHQGLREKIGPTIYVPETQRKSLGGRATILVRAQSPPPVVLPAIRVELAKLSPQAAIDEPRTLAGAVDESIFQDRILATLAECFGVLALLLAAIGLYGVIAYGTAQRTGEFGVRLALGARRRNVLWIVLRDALLLVCAGLAIGLPAALAASRYVASVLFDVKAGDVPSFAGAALILLITGLAAAALPARRSAGMDPMQALRHE